VILVIGFSAITGREGGVAIASTGDKALPRRVDPYVGVDIPLRGNSIKN
jgi:hypothetical protein